MLRPTRSQPLSRVALACERILVEAARATGLSTRRRARRAAHRFVRRHRGDPGYLVRVARRVAACGALAIGLLGLGQGLARAGGAPVFDPFATNPLAGQNVGLRAAPAVADLDADGDLDVLSGEYGGTFRYFRNTGTATAPAYTALSGAFNPANGLSTSSVHSHPAFVDLDGDGDLDLVAGSFNGTLQYFRNTGNARIPLFVASANPFAGIDIGDSSAASFGDLDADGDQDLLLGDRYGFFHYFENTGTQSDPAFVERQTTANPMSPFTIGLDASSLASPALGDVDGDGDLDVVVGFGSGGFRFYQNTGTARLPAFRELLQAANPFRGESVGSAFAKAAMGDLDADGDLDLVSGADAGGLVTFESHVGQFVRSPEVDPDPLGFLNNGSSPVSDLDGDGDVELGNRDCLIASNTGSPSNPSFAGPLALPGAVACTGAPSAVDIDRDGDTDFVAGGRLFINSGTQTTPSFGTSTILFAPTRLHVASGLTMSVSLSTFGDLDRDGDLDAATSYSKIATETSPGNAFATAYFENTGNVTSPAFVERTGVANPLLAGEDAEVRLSDIDADGDSDTFGTFPLLFNFSFYGENVGLTTHAFVYRDPSDRKFPFGRYLSVEGLPPNTAAAGVPTNPGDLDGDGDVDGMGVLVTVTPPLSFHGIMIENSIVRPSPRYFGPYVYSPFSSEDDVGDFARPAVADVDGDGDPDFVVATSFASGAIHYFENTGTATEPDVVEQVGPANPFTGLDAGFTPILSLGDLDGDGDLDLVAGEYYGAPLRYFENTGSATAPAYVQRVGILNPVGEIIQNRGAPSIGDLDHDGDLDLVVGTVDGVLTYYRNDGNATSPLFVPATGAANPFGGIVVGAGFLAQPTLGDVDRDGDLDLVVGNEGSDQFFFFENTGTAESPAFAGRTGVENPLNGLAAGQSATPALADLDADGDLDVVVGQQDGQFRTFYLPEPAMGSVLGLGAALLGWLRRLRGRIRD